jgi:hypothetical protein
MRWYSNEDDDADTDSASVISRAVAATDPASLGSAAARHITPDTVWKHGPYTIRRGDLDAGYSVYYTATGEYLGSFVVSGGRAVCEPGMAAVWRCIGPFVERRIAEM